jgi:hypothetical protein
MIPVVGALALLAAPPEPVRFTGATVGMSAQAGVALLNDDRVGGRAGFTTGVAGRFTWVLFLTDLEVGYHYSRVATGAAGDPFDVVRHSLTLTLGLHPLFLISLQNKRWHYILGSLHLDIGTSLEVTSIVRDASRRTRGDPAWHWGGGVDFPVTDPNEGRSLWIGLRVRQIRLSTDLVRPYTDLGDLQLFLTVGYHWNWK